MPVTTYLSHQERESWKQVKDKELNELLQEMRQIDKGWLIETRLFVNKRFFKTETFERYSLYCDFGIEAQIINFPPNTSEASSINTVVSRDMIMSYLLGYLAGKGDNHAKN